MNAPIHTDGGELTDRPYFQHLPPLSWLVATLAVVAVLAFVANEFLPWLTLGLFVYYVARPIAAWIGRYVGSRTLVVALTLVLIIVPILFFIAAFLGVVIGQAVSVLSSATVQNLLTRLPVQTTQLPSDPVDVVVQVVKDPTASELLGQFGVAVAGISATLYNLFLSLLFGFFLLVEDRRIANWFTRNLRGAESMTGRYLRTVDGGLDSVFFGYTLTIFAIIVLTAIIYTVFNLLSPAGIDIPVALLLAVVTGVFTLVPLVGRSIVYLFIVAILSLKALDVDPTFLWIPVGFFLVMVLLFDNLVRTYIRPYFSGKLFAMPLIMFAYLLGPALFGWYGIFLGPLLMVLVVTFLDDVLPVLVHPERHGLARTGEEPGPAEAGGDMGQTRLPDVEDERSREPSDGAEPT